MVVVYVRTEAPVKVSTNPRVRPCFWVRRKGNYVSSLYNEYLYGRIGGKAGMQQPAREQGRGGKQEVKSNGGRNTNVYLAKCTWEGQTGFWGLCHLWCPIYHVN
ncbi:hypothetical protein Ancab_013294 [Ancistrocladus abbreviatus]